MASKSKFLALEIVFLTALSAGISIVVPGESFAKTSGESKETEPSPLTGIEKPKLDYSSAPPEWQIPGAGVAPDAVQAPQINLDPAVEAAYNTRLAKMEQIAFGAAYPEHDLADRIDHLEDELFKAKGTGTTEQRLAKLETRVFGQNAFGAAPPVNKAPVIIPYSPVSQSVPPVQQQQRIAPPVYSGYAPQVPVYQQSVNQAPVNQQPYNPQRYNPPVNKMPPYTVAPNTGVYPPPVYPNNSYPNSNYYPQYNSYTPVQNLTGSYPPVQRPTANYPYQYPNTGQPYQQYPQYNPTPYQTPYQTPVAGQLPAPSVNPPTNQGSNPASNVNSKNSVACDKVANAIVGNATSGDYFNGVRHFASGSTYHWQNFPVIVHLPKDCPDSWQKALDGAIKKWSQYVPLKVSKGDEKFQVDVQWVNKLPPSIFGVTRFSGSFEDFKVVIFVLRPTFYPSEIPENVLQMVFAHELGHSLGLLAHSTIISDVMYATDSKNPKNLKNSEDLKDSKDLKGSKPLKESKPLFGSATPSARDINTLKKLYSSPPLPAGFKFDQPLEYSGVFE